MTKIVAFFEFCVEIVKVNVLTVMLRGVIVKDQNDLRRVTVAELGFDFRGGKIYN